MEIVLICLKVHCRIHLLLVMLSDLTTNILGYCKQLRLKTHVCW